jgi:hypothetical protein
MDGVETSVYSVMLNCKRQYETLQGTTVETVRELNAYSLLQKVRLESNYLFRNPSHSVLGGFADRQHQ